ncbi:hypothetical protein [Vineibacter terrae]|uniref:hypothetical protein n=1 Tax=Vineibacter terrae TaxID=2586908 RepID=UPI002E37B1EC|nr:hypothetical protein [Vineibacter terrae]HEX2891704.1 hypothetical protein [Vineibacter terrae]
MAKMKHKPLPALLKLWTKAQQNFHLSDAQVHMAIELNMNPTNLGRIANRKGQRWKLKLRDYIAKLYDIRFSKSQPDVVLPIAEVLLLAADRRALGRRWRDSRPATLDDLEAWDPPPWINDRLIPEAPDYEGVVDEAESPAMWT